MSSEPRITIISPSPLQTESPRGSQKEPVTKKTALLLLVLLTLVALPAQAGSPVPVVRVLDSVAVGPSGAIYVGGDSANLLYRIDMRP